MNWLEFLYAMGRNKINFGSNTPIYNRARAYGAIAFVQSLPEDLLEQIIARVDMQKVIDTLNEDHTADKITIREDS